VPLTLSVLDMALSQTRAWLDQGLSMTMAINLSVRHLTDLHLPDQIADALARHGVPGELLTCEVTEGTIMNDPTRSAVVLARIRQLGASIAIDDYGTGYSSLSYLQSLDVDELKIDRSFISELTNPHSEVIVRSTIELGHSLGLRIVAEGVEDGATEDLLASLGCDQIQGFLYTRPLPPDELDRWLAARAATARPGDAELEGAPAW
jgi:EAL domain-containing protein (putative c-di-GMP-specific phosphodiesterase class I)